MPQVVIFGAGSDMTPGIIRELGPGWRYRLVSHKDCDVRIAADVCKVLGTSGQVDLVINLAGISRVQSFVDMDIDDVMDELAVNLYGAFNIAWATTKYAPFAVQVYIASVAGLYGKPEHAGYSASKAGVISLVQSLGMEGYPAYAISPGRVDTKMREHDYPSEDFRTRLIVDEIGSVILDILRRSYTPGDNIIIRRLGYETQPIVVEPTAALRRDAFKVGTNPIR